MTRVRFLDAAGGIAAEADAAPGARLLAVAQACGQPLEGTCGGQMACATCHVVVAAADRARLPPPGAAEDDLLDLVPGARAGSRLACQVVIDAAWDLLTVTVP